MAFDPLLPLARSYVEARIAHTGAARMALAAAVEQVRASGQGSDLPNDEGWLDGEIVADDGVRLTIWCDLGDRVRYRRRMPTAVAMERAERNLREAIASGSCDTDLFRAVVAVFEDEKEPFYSFKVNEDGEPIDPSEKERADADARMKRYRDVFERLRHLVSPGRRI